MKELEVENTSTKLPTQYQSVIHRSRYSRWLDDKGRRETWEETIERICQFWIDRVESSDMSNKDKKLLLEIIG